MKNKIIDSGVCVNLAGLNLPKLFESWILNSVLNYKIELIKSNTLNLKKFHLHSITQLDLSNNCLDSSLPVNYTEYDNISTRKNSNYTCNQLEELELDFNLLTQIPSELFSSKNLKRLNLSNNLIENLPVEVWQSSLYEINLAYNRLNNLPVVAACAQQRRGRKETKRNAVVQKQTPIFKPKNSIYELVRM